MLFFGLKYIQHFSFVNFSDTNPCIKHTVTNLAYYIFRVGEFTKDTSTISIEDQKGIQKLLQIDCTFLPGVITRMLT